MPLQDIRIRVKQPWLRDTAKKKKKKEKKRKTQCREVTMLARAFYVHCCCQALKAL